MTSTLTLPARHAPLVGAQANLALQAITNAQTVTRVQSDVVAKQIARRYKVKVTVMRAGTSKGVFIHRDQLPANVERWKQILPSLMGTPDPYGRQLDGLGGGSSTTSKIAVVSRSKTPRQAQIDYQFVQASTTTDTLDFSGNCGNILSGIGPFAYEEGLINGAPRDGKVTVMLRCLNNDQLFRSTFEVRDGLPVEEGAMVIDGVAGTGSPIKLDFINPAGSLTGALLPTGSATQQIPVNGFADLVSVSCVDAANPFCFLMLESLLMPGEDAANTKTTDLVDRVERVRQAASVVMGITDSAVEASKRRGTPKICIVSPCSRSEEGHIRTQSWSMGTPHPALQLTGAACAAAAIHTPGTILHKLVCAQQADGKLPSGPLRICHPSGAIEVNADVRTLSDGNLDVRSATVYRTARRLFQGEAYFVA